MHSGGGVVQEGIRVPLLEVWPRPRHVRLLLLLLLVAELGPGRSPRAASSSHTTRYRSPVASVALNNPAEIDEADENTAAQVEEEASFAEVNAEENSGKYDV